MAHLPSLISPAADPFPLTTGSLVENPMSLVMREAEVIWGDGIGA